TASTAVIGPSVLGPRALKDVNRLRMGNPPVNQRPRRCREALTRSSAARQHLTAKSASCLEYSFHGGRRTLWWASSEMESAMRRIVAACLIAMGGMLAGAAGQAQWLEIDTVDLERT